MLTPGKGHEEILQLVSPLFPSQNANTSAWTGSTPVPFRNDISHLHVLTDPRL